MISINGHESNPRHLDTMMMDKPDAMFSGKGDFFWVQVRLTIKLDRLIVLSESRLLGWFFHVSLIVIIKGRSPRAPAGVREMERDSGECHEN